MADKNNLKDTEPMPDKHLVIVGDPETGTWSIHSQTSEKTAAEIEYELQATEDPSPRIRIYTGDYVQF